MSLPARVAVVLVHYGSVEETLACIRSVESNDYPTSDIILVDNAQDPIAANRFSALTNVHLIQTGGNLGFTGGSNLGIERALERGCDYVLIVNNDALLEPDCISALVRSAATRPNVAAVGGKICYYDHPDTVWFGGGRLSPTRGLGRHCGQGEPDSNPVAANPESVTFLTGCCLLLSAEAVRRVGCFEEDFFMYVEDVDLSVRLLQAGYTLLYEPAARLYHRVPLREPPIPPHKIILRDRNRRRMARRRFGRADRLRFAAYFYSTRVLHAIRYAARGDTERLRAIWQGMVTP